MKILTSLLAISVFTILTLLAAENKEQDTSLDKIPAKAAEALRKHAGDAKIEHVSKETDDGKVVFEASFKAKGGVREVTVDEAGQTVSEEQTIAIADVPSKARKTIEDKAAGGKIEKLESVKEGGKMKFEALISVKGKRTEVVVGGDGKVLETEDKTNDRDKD